MARMEAPRAQQDAGDALVQAMRRLKEDEHKKQPSFTQDAPWHQIKVSSARLASLAAQNPGYVIGSVTLPATSFSANTLHVR